MVEELSLRRRQILDYIEYHTRKRGYPPTVREIGEAVNLSSPSTVHTHLRRLEEAGLVRREGLLTRTIRSLREDSSPAEELGQRADTVNVPIIGQVAAGQPILAQEDTEGHFGVPSDLLPDGKGFLLRVNGDSMIEAGIFDGDYVVVRQQDTAENGEIIVARLGDEATVKRLKREESHVLLEPANRAMDPIVARDVVVEGKVVGLFRRLD